MKPNRRLTLRREALTNLANDDLRAVAGGQPDSLNVRCLPRISDCIAASLRCPRTQDCPATVDVNRCPTLLC